MSTLGESAGNYAFSVIVLFILAPISLSFVLLHLFRWNNTRNDAADRGKAVLPLQSTISMVTIFMVCIMSVGPIWGFFMRLLFLIDPALDSSCAWVVAGIFVTMYYLGKGSMYLIFVMRLHSIYSVSAFAYSPKVLMACGITICITTTVLCVLTVMDVEVDFYDFNWFGEQRTYCNTQYPGWYIVLYALHELTITVVTLVAFVRPLQKLLRTSHQSNGFKFTAIKVTILTVVAMLTSFFALLFAGLFGTPNLFFIDQFVNVLCIMLMTPYYNTWYPKLCCCCINTCLTCCTCNRQEQKMYHDAMSSTSPTQMMSITPHQDEDNALEVADQVLLLNGLDGTKQETDNLRKENSELKQIVEQMKNNGQIHANAAVPAIKL